MAYTLQAFIGDAAVMGTAVPNAAVVVPLPQGMAMIPLSRTVRDAYNIPSLPLMHGEVVVPENIAAIAMGLAQAGKVAYVEAEFFGGDGTQASTTWDVDGVVSSPLVDPNAINFALRFLGVTVGDYHDEFDALGLGRHRQTECWEQPTKSDPTPRRQKGRQRQP